ARSTFNNLSNDGPPCPNARGSTGPWRHIHIFVLRWADRKFKPCAAQDASHWLQRIGMPPEWSLLIAPCGLGAAEQWEPCDAGGVGCQVDQCRGARGLPPQTIGASAVCVV